MDRRVVMDPDEVDEAASAATTGGLPGLRGPDHFGITVPNLDEAVAFLTQVIGCDLPAFYLGPFADPSGDWMASHLGVDALAELPRIALLRCGAAGANIEVFEYRAPHQADTPPRNSDIGGHHIALYVDDMEAAVAHLKAHGVDVMGEPTVMIDGPSAGETWVYFRAPWGLQMELVSYPRGMRYASAANARRLWDPRRAKDGEAP